MSTANTCEGRKTQMTIPLSRPARPEDIVDLARQHGPSCIEYLAEVANTGSDASRVAACRELLDRAYGKTQQGIKLEGRVEVKHELPEEVLQVLESLYAKPR